uniref:Cytochrome P450 n=1 Tax=Kalanchoe fedtschenkoi TaxID=63787 RepID=A0A7N0V428_KALFE
MENSVLISLLCLLPIVLLTLVYRAIRPNHKNLPPSPPALPIVGNLFQLDDNNLHICLYKLCCRFGPILSLKLGFRQGLVISSAKLAREALKTNDLIYSSRPLLTGIYTMSYSGHDVAFAEYNDYWREMRKLTTIHLFNLKRVMTFSPLRQNEIRRMLKHIGDLAAESKLVDLSAITMSLTCNIICRAAFGKRYEENGEDAKRFHDLLIETQASFGQLYFRDYFPYTGWLDVLNGAMGRLKIIFKKMDDFYQQIIDEHLDPNRPKAEVEDFIDVMIGIKKTSKDLTWEQIKGVLMNVFVGGSETSASSLVWGMALLAMNPPILKKATDEIRSAYGHKEYIDEEDTSKLPYLKAVVKEIMRMYTATPLLIPRETIDKSIVGGYEIPAKTLVYVNAWAIGRDPDEWEKPHDFYPDRFLGKDIDFKGTDFELIPFGSGRRICPGIHMGSVTVEVGLANLLNAFDWRLPGGVKSEDIDMGATTGIVMHKKVPLILAVKNRVVG